MDKEELRGRYMVRLSGEIIKPMVDEGGELVDVLEMISDIIAMLIGLHMPEGDDQKLVDAFAFHLLVAIEIVRSQKRRGAHG